MENNNRKGTIWKNIKYAAIGFAVGFLAMSLLVATPQYRKISAQEDEIKELKAELKLLYEEESEEKKTEITETAVWETLAPIRELNTFLVDYGNTYAVTTTRTGIFGETVPFSKNSLNFMYHGVIKVGIDMDLMDIEVDQDRQIITVTLPEPEVLDNYIRLDELQCSAQNNLLNPLDVTELPGILTECADKELTSAESQGLYSKATSNAKLIITDLLAIFPEYRVVFQ